MDLLRHESGLLYRDSKDLGVINEQNRCYRALKDHPVRGLYLDVGAYIGTFAWWAKANLTPSRIVSVEPYGPSADVLEANYGSDPDVTIIRAAAVADGSTDRDLYLGRTYSSCNTLAPIRGRIAIPVKTVDWQSLLDLEPVLIKCDIEGGEYGLPWGDLPDSVVSLAFEFHQNQPGWLEGQHQIHDVLLAQGFSAVREPAPHVTFQKVTMGVYWRESPLI